MQNDVLHAGFTVSYGVRGILVYMLPRNPYLLPGAILAGGIIIAVAVFMVRTGGTGIPTPPTDVSFLRPVTTTDHIVGSPDARIILVEYSDIDCEFCKSFQETLTQILSEYGPTSDVAWVYRHFPNVSEHGFALEHARASECAAQQGGNELFFRFIDAIAQKAPGGSQFDPVGYPDIIASLGLSQARFDTCMQSSEVTDRVTADFENALAIGADGAPFSVLLVQGKKPVPISGALPYESMKQIIEATLKDN